MPGGRITAEKTRFLAAAAMLAFAFVVGCAQSRRVSDSDLVRMLADVRTSDAGTNTAEPATYIASDSAPFSVRDALSSDWASPQPWDLTIDETIQIALANSTVLRSLGARVIQTPGSTPTIYEPAIATSDGTSGVEAALSAFDAQARAEILVEDNERVLNNEFVGGGVNFFQQQLATFSSSLSKRTVVGTLFTLRNNFNGDLNNSERNLITGRAWSWNIEGEVRHPLLQGRGVMFNRVAGPNATPGVFNGVVIAKLNSDVTVAQLEIALRDYLSDVENAYWDLYFAFADLDVKVKARDRSLNTFRLLKARSELPGAEKDKLAQAKEQYYRFEQDVQNAMAGRLVVGTRAFNGSGGGTFQGTGGVYASERRLRLIMGLPINDGRLIRTASVPAAIPITYDWNDLVSNAMARRTELRRQKLNVERRRYELAASRNFLLPRVDAIGRYRYRGLGDDLYDRRVLQNNDLVSSDTHEFLMGVSLAYPVGFRQAHAAVRNAQLRLSREKALQQELERQVVYGISNAMAENDRAYGVLRIATDRAQAAQDQYDILNDEAQAQVRQFDFNSLLDSEQRLAEATTGANRAAVQYALATKNLNFEMGALLEYFNIHLTDGNRPRGSVVSSAAAYAVAKQAPVETVTESPLMDSTVMAPNLSNTSDIDTNLIDPRVFDSSENNSPVSNSQVIGTSEFSVEQKSRGVFLIPL